MIDHHSLLGFMEYIQDSFPNSFHEWIYHLESFLWGSRWSPLILVAISYLIIKEHCYITGGSQGLGKALAIDLARQGAHVTIVARKREILGSAVEEIKKFVISKHQKINYISADVSQHLQSVDALKKAKELVGKSPEYIFTVAGYSRPGYLIELDHSEFEKQMQLNYMGTVYTIQESVRTMIKENIQGKIVMVSSVAGLVSFVGYSSYSPTKAALRGFAEALRSELLEHNIDVHIYFPGTIDSPGLIQEEKTKPELTKIIEGDDKITPEYGSKIVLKGMARNYFMITSDFIGDVCRASSSCAAPWNNFLYDSIYSLLSVVICRYIGDNEKREEI